ncbi:uncharacterized protein AMSG_03696 [Thecamonas trahens ATCC 50062]|uniref:CAP-Gly domain-containing protein n=1 Tax=Thecamonas trahens ATCC 50062 TaxID=461836 RepID=A0A0L0D5B3_THETB|nr:hypothetical protein AMSG_03696 [Thecamonas trahens ATCC 50062]KNC47266.1 hypothetical protein AMSG_03696 [Thecamonas trahens ATCC 50062]|eukprot:XP_013759609.1 hypothetical protein AMSG_03696 [Thecamonas trahens ATCC 50062]
MAVDDNELARAGWDTADEMRVGAWCLVDELHPGTVAFVGSIVEAEGTWVGVTLDAPLGDLVQGPIRYFAFKKGYGMMVHPARVRIVPKPMSQSARAELEREARAAAARRRRLRRRSSRSPPPSSPALKLDSQEAMHDLVEAEKVAKLARRARLRFPIGTRVVVNGTHSGEVCFIGATEFAHGLWFGIHLDEPGEGNCDGSINGVDYFDSEPDTAVFVRKAALVRIASAPLRRTVV